MFHSTRLKLTAWYLLIIMVISLAFSVIIYHILSLEVNRFAKMQRFRFEHRFEQQLPLPPPQQLFYRDLDPDLIAEVKHRLIVSLVVINSIIFITAGGLGYFLAGRTLKPIKTMLDNQQRFISDASHELRTPLTALKTSMEVYLRDPTLTLANAKTLLKDNLEDINSLQRLADHLLQLVHVNHPHQPLHKKRLNIATIITKATRQLEAIAQQKNIQLISNLEEISIQAAEHQLQELFVILLDNAIKYSPNQSIVSIKTKIIDSCVQVTIQDQGIGISKKDLPHIFERFYRANHARTKTGQNGYGLGLSIAQQIVTMHHGTIQIDSQKSKGCTVRVRLPL